MTGGGRIYFCTAVVLSMQASKQAKYFTKQASTMRLKLTDEHQLQFS